MRTQRLDSITQYVQEEKSATLDKLCELFQISKNTIRRDVDTLVKDGKLKKVYGGVIYAGEEHPVKVLLSYEERSNAHRAEKNAICKMAADLIEDKDTIYIDTGTTCLDLIDYISHKEVTIITNSLQVCSKAIPYPNLDIISLPGRLKRATLSFTGADIASYLGTYNITKAFMACSGITIDNGLTNASTDEYVVKKNVIANSAQIILLADHSKFGHFALMTYCPFKKIDCIVTDRSLSPDYQDYCRESGIQVLISDRCRPKAPAIR